MSLEFATGALSTTIGADLARIWLLELDCPAPQSNNNNCPSQKNIWLTTTCSIGDVTYSYSSGWRSALTDPQWQQLYDYQTAFNVRMVRLDVYPGAEYGIF